MPERLSLQSIIPYSLVNWEQIGSTTWTCVKKKKKNPSFFPKIQGQLEQLSTIPKSLCELGKTCKITLRLTLKNPNLKSTGESGKVRS